MTNKYIKALGRIPIRIKVAVMLIFTVLVVVLLGYSVLRLVSNDSNLNSFVTISMSDDIKIPKNYRTIIENAISLKILDNVELSDLKIANGVIRDSSYKEEEKGDNSYRSKFIVDVESMHYSFAVEVEWSSKDHDPVDPEIVLACPHYLDAIYKDKKCIAADPISQLKAYLPHYGRVNGIKYAVDLIDISSNNYVKIEAPVCKNDVLLREVEKDAKRWMRGIYLDPNDYTIITTSSCRE